jgi:hypothetical protein
MIRPTRHLDLDTCVLNVATRVARRLREHGPTKHGLLIDLIQDELGPAAKFQFPLAVSLLYLLGMLDYNEDGDLFYRVDPGHGAPS